MKQIETDFDYSMMRAFHNCRRRYYYPYVLSITPIKTAVEIVPGAMEFGSSVDAGLDFAYQILSLNKNQQEKLFHECFKDAEFRPNRMQTVAQIAAIAIFKAEWGTVVNKGYSAQLGHDLLAEYFARWFPEGFDTVDSQIAGPVPVDVRHDFETNLMIKADRLVYGYDPNRYSIFEVKTTSNPNDIWWTGQEMSYQCDGYVLGAEVFTGLTVHSAIIDCLGTKVAKGKTRTERRPIIMSRGRRHQYYRWLTSTIDEIMKLQIDTMNKFGHFGPNIAAACYKATQEGGKPHDLWPENRSNCTDFWRVCEYKELCTNDCHMGALSLFEDNPWRPYMPK